jgi:FG-GAP repeat
MNLEPRKPLRALAFALAITGAGDAQAVLMTIPVPPTSAQYPAFGRTVAGGADLSGDGIPDIVVGAPQDGTGTTSDGVVRIYSGADGALLHTVSGQAGGSDQLGYSVAVAGDLSGDGIADVLIGAPSGSGPNGQTGYVRYVLGGSFATGVMYGPPLLTPNGAALEGYGVSVDGAGDVNGDGIGDAVVARPGTCWPATYNQFCQVVTPGWSFAGHAQLLAGGSGQTLASIPGAVGQSFPSLVAGIGDVNTDGFSDCLLVSRVEFGTNMCFGTVTCPAFPARFSMRSGASGTELWGYSPAAGMAQLAASRVGDLNADGRPDVIVRAAIQLMAGGFNYLTAVLSGANGSSISTVNESIPTVLFPTPVSCAGVQDLSGDGIPDYLLGEASLSRVRVFSGASHAMLYQVNGPPITFPPSSHFGYSICSAGDVNGDGFGDFIVGNPLTNIVQVISGRTLASVVDLGGGCAPSGPAAALSSTPPILGQPITLSVAGGPHPTRGVIASGSQANPPVVVMGGPSGTTPCQLFIDPATMVPLVAIATDPTGAWTFGAVVPSTPSLLGFNLVVQGWFFPSAGGFDSSNALRLTVGN